MRSADIRRLMSYHRWANQRYLAAVAELTAEEADRDLKSSFPSVRATLVHLMSAEWVWVQRWKGTSPTSFPDSAGLSTIAAVRQRWSEIESEQERLLERMTDERLARPLAYRNLKGEPFESPICDQVQHVVNHATFHRGQVATMLRQLGKQPPGTDFVTFLREA